MSYSSIAMPKLPGKEIVFIQNTLFISRIDKPAIIGVRMPAVSMFHTIQRMATVVVRIGGGGGRGKRKRKKQKLEHLEGCESCVEVGGLLGELVKI